MNKYISVKKSCKVIALALILCVSFCLIFEQGAHAYTSSQLRQKSKVSTLSSGKSTEDNYIKFSTKGNAIDVTFNHSQSFEMISLRLEQKNVVKYKRDFYNSETGAFTEHYDFSGVTNGNYYLRIVVKVSANKANGLTNYPTYWQGVYVSVKSGVPAMYNFNYITKANDAKKGSPSAYYKTKSLSDLKYQLFNKKGSKTPRSISTTKETAFYKTVSDKVLSDAGLKNSKDNYAKMKELFAFVANSFYYDYQNSTRGRSAYDDPYYNLYYLTKKTGNSYNAYSGKVAMHCDGFAGVLVALGRSQGIPCRMIYGRKIVPKTTSDWTNCSSKYFSSNSHTWMQAWIDGRWVNIDPQQGSLNMYGKSGVSSDKTWRKSSIINYTYFDISHKLLSYTHYARTMPKGKK